MYSSSADETEYLGEKRLSPRRASTAGGSLLPLSPRRTPVRLKPLLYQVSGHRQICFRHRGGLSNARVPSAAQTASFPVSLTSRGTCHLNPQPVSLELAALAPPGLLPRRSASASLSARKICPAYFFDRNRTSKKLRQLPKPRLSAAAHRTN